MLTDQAHKLATGANYGMISTITAGGRIQTQPVWVDSDGEHLLVNTEIHRAKFKNLEANPTVTVTVTNSENHYNWSEVRGRLVGTVGGQEARDHIDKLAKKYMGVDDYPNPIQSERVMLKIAPERVVDWPPS
jgi:PPOX class probable F420-dependent enzyme